MSNANSATPGKNIAMTLVGLMTLPCGVGYAVAGGRLILVWADWLPAGTGDLWDQIASMSPEYERNFALIPLFGMFFLVFGAMILLAALGLLRHKYWGRAMTFMVAVPAMAIPLGLSLLNINPPTGLDANSVLLVVAQVLYGTLAYATLSMNRGEPLGIHVLRVTNTIGGLLTVYFSATWLSELIPGVFTGPDSARDPDSRFAALAGLSGIFAGVLLIVSGRYLLTRFVTIASVSVQVAMVAFALLGLMLGDTMAEIIDVMFLVVAIVLLILTASGVWYLNLPHVRRALEARMPAPGIAEPIVPAGQPRD